MREITATLELMLIASRDERNIPDMQPVINRLVIDSGRVESLLDEQDLILTRLKRGGP